jgi:hypothetical protein
MCPANNILSDAVLERLEKLNMWIAVKCQRRKLQMIQSTTPTCDKQVLSNTRSIQHAKTSLAPKIPHKLSIGSFCHELCVPQALWGSAQWYLEFVLLWPNSVPEMRLRSTSHSVLSLAVRTGLLWWPSLPAKVPTNELDIAIPWRNCVRGTR